MKELEDNEHLGFSIYHSLPLIRMVEIHKGSLIKFDNKICYAEAVKEIKDELEMPQAMAQMCILLLDEVASIVDHIPHEDGGTYGDAIRNFNKG